jgi:hypothetical protein
MPTVLAFFEITDAKAKHSATTPKSNSLDALPIILRRAVFIFVGGRMTSESGLQQCARDVTSKCRLFPKLGQDSFSCNWRQHGKQTTLVLATEQSDGFLIATAVAPLHCPELQKGAALSLRAVLTEPSVDPCPETH